MVDGVCVVCLVRFGLGPSQIVSPAVVSLRLVLARGIVYNGRSFLNLPLNRLTSAKQAVLTISDLGLNADRYRPESLFLVSKPMYI